MQFQPSSASDLPSTTLSAPVFLGLGALLLGGAAAVYGCVIPFALSAVVPEWSYRRRVAAGIAASLAVGAAGSLARALHGNAS